LIRTLYLRIGHLLESLPADAIAVGLPWLILIVPSALVNGLFSLDLGGIYDKAANLPGSLGWILSPYNGSGRYFPLYWLYYTSLFKLFSWHVGPLYAIQSAFFLASTLMACHLYRKAAGPGVTATLFAVSIFLATPNVESLYTLGKAEPMVFFFVASILLIFHSQSGETYRPSPWRVVSVAALFACSMWFKETSEVMLVFAGTGIAVTWLAALRQPPPARHPTLLRRYAELLLALMIGGALSKVPYLLFRPGANGTAANYTKYPITPLLVWNNVYFYATQQPDVVCLGLFASFAVLFLWLRRGAALREDARAMSSFTFVASLLAMGWSYLAGLLIWRWPMSYYLFLPAIVFRFGAAYGACVAWRNGLFSRPAWLGIRFAAIALAAYAAIYLWYTGCIQVGYSRVYTQAIHEYLRTANHGESLTFESYPFYSEQVTNTKQLIDVMFHQERKLNGIADLVNPAALTPEMTQLFHLTEAILRGNEPKWPHKGDFVIAFTGNDLATWQVRGVAPWYSDGSDLWRDGAYEMQVVSERRVHFPALFLNVWTRIPSFHQTYVGYQLYRVAEGPRYSWLGRFPDGWMGKRARLILYPEFAGKACLYVSTSTYNPVNTVSVFRDDVPISKAALSPGREWSVELETLVKDRPTTFRVEMTSTFSPKKLWRTDDMRELGGRLRLESLRRD